MAMKLDRSAINGDISVLDFASLALAFNVDVDAINLDDYLPPSAKGKAATPGAAATALPVDLVRSLNLDGQLRIGNLTVGGIEDAQGGGHGECQERCAANSRRWGRRCIRGAMTAT